MIKNGPENRGCPNMTTGKVVNVSQQNMRNREFGEVSGQCRVIAEVKHWFLPAQSKTKQEWNFKQQKSMGCEP